MDTVLTAAVGFAGGFAVEFVNWLLTRSALERGSGAAMILPLRCVLAAGYLALLYLAGGALGADTTVLLIAAAVGLSAGLIVFTLLLMRNNGKDGGTNG